MTEVTPTTTDSKKTITSFIIGLVIGGLLVWAFIAPKEAHHKHDEEKRDDASSTSTAPVVSTSTEATTPTTTTTAPNVSENAGAVTVGNQPAGRQATVSQVTFPIREGWIGVREYTDGRLGFINGVIRFSASGNLNPTTVPLQTPTIAGRQYAIVMFTEDGDRGFNPATDRQLETLYGTFTAQ